MRKLYVKDTGGVWRTIQNVWVKKDGVWQQIYRLYVNNGGTWNTHYIRGFVFAPTITGEVSDYNLRNAAIAAGWDQSIPLLATVTVANGGVLKASTTSTYAFDTGSSFPTGSILNLTVQSGGYIVGKGGKGGNGTRILQGPATAGAPGGVGMKVRAALNVTNNGIIGGGGGGGGGGGATDGGGGAGGGGGGGASYGDPGTPWNGDESWGDSGTAGGLTTGGAGGDGTGTVTVSNRGGTGGNLGQAGAAGGWNDNGFGSNEPNGAGGAAGNAVEGNGLVTWATLGDVRGNRV